MDGTLESDVHRVYIIRFCQLAATVGALYDHVLTFDDEIRFIWRKRWSVTKCLFLVNRYLGFLMLLANAIVFMSNNIPERVRYVYLRVQALTSALLIVIVQAIMQYRLYAIYERSRVLVISLGALWAAEIIGMGVVLGLVASDGVGATTNIPGTSLGICTPSPVPQYFYTFWIPIMVFESVMFALACYKGFSHIVQFAMYGDWWCPAMLSGVLVRDSIVYFFFNFTAYLVAALLWALLPPEYLEVPEGFTVGITCVMGARMILNLREAYARAPQVSVFSTGVPGQTDIGWVPDVNGNAVEGEGEEPVVRPVWWMKPPETRRQCVATNARRKTGRDVSEKTPAMAGPAYRVDATYTPRPKRFNNGMRMAHGRRRGQEESFMEFAHPAGKRATDTFASSVADVEMGAVDVRVNAARDEAITADTPTTLVGGELSQPKSAKAKGKAKAMPAVRSFGSVISEVGSVLGGGSRARSFGRAGAARAESADAAVDVEVGAAAPVVRREAPLRVRTDFLLDERGPPSKKSQETLLGTPATPYALAALDSTTASSSSESRGRSRARSESVGTASSVSSASGSTRREESAVRGPPGTFSF